MAKPARHANGPQVLITGCIHSPDWGLASAEWCRRFDPARLPVWRATGCDWRPFWQVDQAVSGVRSHPNGAKIRSGTPFWLRSYLAAFEPADLDSWAAPASRKVDAQRSQEANFPEFRGQPRVYV